MDLIGSLKPIGISRADPLSIWAVSDGRAGIAAQAVGLAEAIARRTPAVVSAKKVALRSPWLWLPPGLTPAPLQALSLGSDFLEPPWPDIWIGCGRQSIPFSMAVRGWSKGRTLVVQLQDPRINPREFDIVCPPHHDGLEGPNLMVTLGACHRVTPERVAQEASAFPSALNDLPRPRVAVLIGGKSKRQSIGPRRAEAIVRELVRLKQQTNAVLLATLSRRTSPTARRIFSRLLAPECALFFDGAGDNPYFAILAAADFILVTADSVSMAAEACATGTPVLVLPVDGDPGKLAAFHQGLYERGCARPYLGSLERWTYEPLLEADRLARRIVELIAQRAAANSGRFAGRPSH